MAIHCENCAQSFELNASELRLLARLSPVFCGKEQPFLTPRLCRACREQRRLSYRNERKLYYRNCDLTGKRMISLFAPESPFKVYTYDAWWSDRWDAGVYAREFDFNKPFFPQLAELWRDVPQLNLISSRNQASDYTNFSEQLKNCYLVFAGNRDEDCLYSEYLWDSKTCVDCTNVEASECCYMCVECARCHSCVYCQECQESHDLDHCYDCQGCSCLFGCSGLRRASYCILNKHCSPAEYKERLLDPGERAAVIAAFPRLKEQTPRRFAKIINCENCSGSNLRDCRNLDHAFNAFQVEDGCNLENVPGKSKDLMDISGSTHSELGYELVSVAYGYNLAFCLYSHTGLSDSCYSALCTASSNLFGCIGMRNGKYCILNKQYTKDDYEQTALRIVEHMRKTGEWGENFPVEMSPWHYNETAAADHYPLPKAQVLKRGWKWLDDMPGQQQQTAAVMHGAALPQDPHEVSDELIKNNVFLCEETGKHFRIIPQELAFYRRFSLPPPRLSPEARYLKRLAQQTPRRLWPRRCDCAKAPAGHAPCANRFMSTYQPGGPEKVYCEECYLRSVY